jgi:Holliday junction resolvase
MTTAHAKLCGAICEFFKKNGIWYVRTNSQGYGRKGIPDILACYQGSFIAIEAKVAPDKPQKWQERELAAIRAAGGKALVIYDVAELGRLMPVPVNWTTWRPVDFMRDSSLEVKTTDA